MMKDSMMPMVWAAIKELERNNVPVNIPNVVQKTGLKRHVVLFHMRTMADMNLIPQVLTERVMRIIEHFEALDDADRTTFLKYLREHDHSWG